MKVFTTPRALALALGVVLTYQPASAQNYDPTEDRQQQDARSQQSDDDESDRQRDRQQRRNRDQRMRSPQQYGGQDGRMTQQYGRPNESIWEQDDRIGQQQYDRRDSHTYQQYGTPEDWIYEQEDWIYEQEDWIYEDGRSYRQDGRSYQPYDAPDERIYEQDRRSYQQQYDGRDGRSYQQDDRSYQQRGRRGTPAGLGVALATERTANGVRVMQVMQGSPASEAGIRPGDVITRIGNVDVNTPRELIQAVVERNPGQQVNITIERNGERQSLRAQLTERQDALSPQSQGQNRSQYRSQDRSQDSNRGRDSR